MVERTNCKPLGEAIRIPHKERYDALDGLRALACIGIVLHLGSLRFELANMVMYALWLIYAVSEASSSRKWTFFNNKVMAFLSGVSMEVYLCHMMFFRVVEKLHLEKHISNPDFVYWLTCALVLCGAIFFAIVWKKVEKRIHAIYR